MVTRIILEQLGGNRFIVMTGSKKFFDIGDGLQMNLARNKTQANRLSIRLDRATDSYTMRFYRQTLTKEFEIKVKEIAEYNMIYFDMLEEIFTEVTGLYTRL